MITLKLTSKTTATALALALTAITTFCPFAATTAYAKVYNVMKYGALGNGKQIDTPAINKAIEDASNDADGVVVFPKGTYMCYSIHLKCNITLKFEDGAVIKAAEPTDSDGYDPAEPFEGKTYQDYGHSHWQNSLMWGIGLENIRIEGRGIIDGGKVLSPGHFRNSREANKAISLKNCRNVEIKDITMLTCGHFAMLLTGVDNLTIDGVTIDSNRDGMDIDCCEHVTIRNCTVNTLNDDAIVLKCSYALNSLKPTADVLIENCSVSGYDIGTLYDGTYGTKVQYAVDRDGPTGRIKLGTESNSVFRDITIRNCKLTHCRGLAFETVDGALLENVNVENIQMDDICNSPIYMVIGTRMRTPDKTILPRLRNVTISNVKATECDSRYAILLSGQPGNPIENITLRNISVQYRGDRTMEDYKQQRGGNDFFHKYETNYPEPSAHGIQPAWGLSMQHVRNITLDNVVLKTTGKDERPMTYKEDVE